MKKMKRVACLGAGGFIGTHLVRFLKKKGYWVRGVDKKYPQWSKSDADEFLKMDLRYEHECDEATKGVDEVYQLAADMGGMGFISKEHIASLFNSNLINTYIPEACVKNKVKRLFFSSSACVYSTFKQTELDSPLLKEEDVYPAHPNEAYGWEKLLAEIRYQAYQEEGKLEVRIARFENTYGPEGTYEGGREKAPAALCRKVALAKSGDSNEGLIEVWGDGKAQRSYMFVEDLVTGIWALMNSDYKFPMNLGSDEVVSVNELAQTIIDISGKKLNIKNVEGPQGVRSRFIDHSVAQYVIGWNPQTMLYDGLRRTYSWVAKQVGLNK